MAVTVKFRGGPRHGESKEYSVDPIVLGVLPSEAKKKTGIYKTEGVYGKAAREGNVTATWHETRQKTSN